ncbi:uncharacterized protein L969DRAFT_55472 [Mixia osmundae IAM 14324]|uniref:PAS domain-containing protein n=1 Tax=Mixia osmundae (strain CBS 9802 / IAM 14324 / JCM 22182 / KY 12970) TaxID=764103 RepID=G7E4D6_MIXOS|nr:uncharacterized protein L969DRAFT_55472 [Mixia osmundae IAM 14324]KEI36287.1 hypothetical protein L969DRAFT_55472 [Mixia osmundae IAM 14324]GAA97696.1 hypothetical protein E5Q_04374 [Mixia osmundae IAM 14324]
MDTQFMASMMHALPALSSQGSPYVASDSSASTKVASRDSAVGLGLPREHAESTASSTTTRERFHDSYESAQDPYVAPDIRDDTDASSVEDVGAELTPDRRESVPYETTSKLFPAPRTIVQHDQTKSNLASWAPTAAPVPTQTDNLPEVGESNMTALPISKVQQELNSGLLAMMSLQIFEDLLKDPLGRHRFREWYITNRGHPGKIDMYWDAAVFARLLTQLSLGATGIRHLYVQDGAPLPVHLTSEAEKEVTSTLLQLEAVQSSFQIAQSEILQEMYASEFPAFVKAKLVQEAHVQLGKLRLDAEGNSSGLGDCWCLTNPRLKDHPIVLASPGFEDLTGYTREEICGRNCRFLQGPSSSQESVGRIRDALNRGEGCSELILNYRRSGQPFYCLLTIMPLKSKSGDIVYFLGGQVDVGSSFANKGNLNAFLLGGAEATNTATGNNSFSPTMVAYNSALASGMSAKQSYRSASQRAAAGTLYQDGNDDKSLYDAVQPRKTLASRIFSTGRSKRNVSSATMTPKQGIVGAEASLGATTLPIDQQIERFESAYTRVLVFRPIKTKLEVLFLTPMLLQYLGQTDYNAHLSRYVHKDLLSLLTAGTKEATRAMRRTVLGRVMLGKPYSIESVGVKCLHQAKLLREADYTTKWTRLHITPLQERQGNVVAFTAVFA